MKKKSLSSSPKRYQSPRKRNNNGVKKVPSEDSVDSFKEVEILGKEIESSKVYSMDPMERVLEGQIALNQKLLKKYERIKSISKKEVQREHELYEKELEKKKKEFEKEKKKKF